ncbi:MAG: hypothetical protein PHH00_01560 [Candidatus Nanoarchaeia archaeon]|nr:hypothetical protein [Candidatus Nanoarchaeia archaeon]
MAKTTDKQIDELPAEDRDRFMKTLGAVLEDSVWQALRGLEGTGCEMIKMVLYREMFDADFSYLNRGEQQN